MKDTSVIGFSSERPLPVFFRNEDGVPLSGVAQLYQVLSIDRALLYVVGTYMDTKPDIEVTDVQFKLR